jgi:hypothetical protein
MLRSFRDAPPTNLQDHAGRVCDRRVVTLQHGFQDETSWFVNERVTRVGLSCPAGLGS